MVIICGSHVEPCLKLSSKALAILPGVHEDSMIPVHAIIIPELRFPFLERTSSIHAMSTQFWIESLNVLILICLFGPRKQNLHLDLSE